MPGLRIEGTRVLATEEVVKLDVHSGKELAGRQIALTGAGGFIGSHLLARLVAAGASVDVLGPIPMTRPEVCQLLQSPEVEYRPRALLHEGALAASLRGCDSLVHLNYRLPTSSGFWAQLADEVRANLLPTVRLLDVAEVTGVGQLCFASSAGVYSPPARYVTEYDAVGGGVSSYALVKLEQEACLRQWSHQTGRPTTILRLTTVYGPGETVDRAIPNFIRAVLSHRAPTVNGRGVEPFDPIHVDDVAEAFVCSLAQRVSGTFNIGTGLGRSPREVAALVIRLCGADCDVAENHDARDRGGPICDVSRAAAVLGFQARMPLELGLEQEIAWHRNTQLSESA